MHILRVAFIKSFTKPAFTFTSLINKVTVNHSFIAIKHCIFLSDILKSVFIINSYGEKKACKTQSNHHNASVLKFKFQLVEAIKISNGLVKRNWLDCKIIVSNIWGKQQAGFSISETERVREKNEEWKRCFIQVITGEGIMMLTWMVYCYRD